MIRHIYSILCNDLITDKATNSTSYIKTVDQISAQLPYVVPVLTVGSYWEINKELIDIISVRLKLVTPGLVEHILLKVDTKVGDNQRINFHLQNTKIEESGIYNFFIEYFHQGEWLATSKLPLKVIEIGQQSKENELLLN